MSANIVNQIRLVTDPLFMRLRAELYGSGNIFGDKLSMSKLPVGGSTGLITKPGLQDALTSIGYNPGITIALSGVVIASGVTKLDFYGAGFWLQKTTPSGVRITISGNTGVGSSNDQYARFSKPRTVARYHDYFETEDDFFGPPYYYLASHTPGDTHYIGFYKALDLPLTTANQQNYIEVTIDHRANQASAQDLQLHTGYRCTESGVYQINIQAGVGVPSGWQPPVELGIRVVRNTPNASVIGSLHYDYEYYEIARLFQDNAARLLPIISSNSSAANQQTLIVYDVTGSSAIECLKDDILFFTPFVRFPANNTGINYNIEHPLYPPKLYFDSYDITIFKSGGGGGGTTTVIEQVPSEGIALYSGSTVIDATTTKLAFQNAHVAVVGDKTVVTIPSYTTQEGTSSGSSNTYYAHYSVPQGVYEYNPTSGVALEQAYFDLHLKQADISWPITFPTLEYKEEGVIITQPLYNVSQGNFWQYNVVEDGIYVVIAELPISSTVINDNNFAQLWATKLNIVHNSFGVSAIAANKDTESFLLDQKTLPISTLVDGRYYVRLAGAAAIRCIQGDALFVRLDTDRVGGGQNFTLRYADTDSGNVIIYKLGGGSSVNVEDIDLSAYYTKAQVDAIAATKAASTHQHGVNDITNLNTAIANHTDVAAAKAKITNATHTGDVAGSGYLTLQPGVVKPYHLNTENVSDGMLLVFRDGAWKAMYATSSGYFNAVADSATHTAIYCTSGSVSPLVGSPYGDGLFQYETVYYRERVHDPAQLVILPDTEYQVYVAPANGTYLVSAAVRDYRVNNNGHSLPAAGYIDAALCVFQTHTSTSAVSVYVLDEQRLTNFTDYHNSDGVACVVAETNDMLRVGFLLKDTEYRTINYAGRASFPSYVAYTMIPKGGISGSGMVPHADSHMIGGNDVITPASIGATALSGFIAHEELKGTSTYAGHLQVGSGLTVTDGIVSALVNTVQVTTDQAQIFDNVTKLQFRQSNATLSGAYIVLTPGIKVLNGATTITDRAHTIVLGSGFTITQPSQHVVFLESSATTELNAHAAVPASSGTLGHVSIGSNILVDAYGKIAIEQPYVRTETPTQVLSAKTRIFVFSGGITAVVDGDRVVLSAGDVADFVSQTVTSGNLVTAPSEHAVFSALATKAALDHTHVASGITNFNAAVASAPSVVLNTAKITNATHTGAVTGSGYLTITSGAVHLYHLNPSEALDGQVIMYSGGSWIASSINEVAITSGFIDAGTNLNRGTSIRLLRSLDAIPALEDGEVTVFMPSGNVYIGASGTVWLQNAKALQGTPISTTAPATVGHTMVFSGGMWRAGKGSADNADRLGTYPASHFIRGVRSNGTAIANPTELDFRDGFSVALSGSIAQITVTSDMTPATDTVLGKVIIGAGITVEPDGRISVPFASGMQDPTTSVGDLIVRTVDDVVRLPVGGNNTVLTVISGFPTWSTPTTTSGGGTTIIASGTGNDSLFLWYNFY